MQKNGQLLQDDYFDNVGGLNISDSPFKVTPNQSTGGSNYTYTQTGGIQTRHGLDLVNTVADSQLQTWGLGIHITAAGVKTNIRAAGTKLQSINIDTAAFTALTADTTAASSNFLSTTTQPVVFSQFNTATINTLWCAGGGMSSIYGVYSSTKATANGVAAPTGTISAAVNTHNSGVWAAAGKYFYAVAFRKASTQAISNVALDVVATTVNTDDTVTITLSTISNIDTTLYDQIYIYRSAIGGVTAFTTGDLVAQVASNVTSYVDTGTSVASTQNVPRANNTILDNSVLPTATYYVVTTWKRHLVTANNSTVYISDLNKPESWPTTNILTIPSGGPITALGVISFSTELSNDEYLAVFKERELWIITGTTYADFSLKFIDNVGCPSQSLLVAANGFLSWIDFRGVHLWSGNGKPIYLSRPLEPLFDKDGDLDKTKLSMGYGVFSRKQNSIIWFISHKTYGTQKFAIKLDLRLTLPSVQNTLGETILDGIFLIDTYNYGLYGVLSYLPTSSSDETLLVGDSSGFIYKAYNVFADSGTAYSMTYQTKFMDQGNPNIVKRYHKVIVWVEEVGTWNLTLDYWSSFRSSTQELDTISLPVSSAPSNATALWDIGVWDAAYWDNYSVRRKGLIFNLVPGVNNSNEGNCLKLQFRQDNANQPVTICGFSVIYSEKGAS